MKLEDLGYNSEFEQARIEQNLQQFELARVISEHRERYIVRTAEAEFEAEITGHLRFNARNREDFPAVGDWVALSACDAGFAIICKIFPRFSILKRQAVGQFGEIQIIASNIDFAFLVQSADRDFNLNRLERYLTICNASGVSPIILLTKTDLIEPHQVAEILEMINTRIRNVPVIAISNQTQEGYEAVKAILEKGKTYCMLGSSGVGKSTLLNNLIGQAHMRTDSISEITNKGRHVTSHRELIILENGSILIDNPGMREVGIADATDGLALTFDRIITLSQKCRFIDCTHTTEVGCAVLLAVGNDEIDKSAYDNFQKMEREKIHFEATVEEKRKKEKEFGKIMKNYKKTMKRNRF